MAVAVLQIEPFCTYLLIPYIPVFFFHLTKKLYTGILRFDCIMRNLGPVTAQVKNIH